MHDRSTRHSNLRNKVRPALERLEDRLLLYSTLGAQWSYSSRITYSFLPDGTSVGGTPSVLFQTLNARFATANWQSQVEQAAALWEANAGVNLALVSDNGAPVSSSGDQQDDPNFGDIRIGAIPLSSSTLAMAFLPPPINGGTDAGDILINSNINFQINSNYDLMTVMAHEFGHSLGMGHTQSANTTAVMYRNYNGIKQSLTSDDTSGIQSIYGAPQPDAYDSNGSKNNTAFNSANISSSIGSNGQIAIPALEITTINDVDWYSVTVPSSTTGAMTVTVQSSNLSSLAPQLLVYNSSLSLLGQASAPSTFGATVSVTIPNVQAGQSYRFKVMAAGGPGPIGSYGLLVNFGSQSQAPIAPPNTVVASKPDEGASSLNDSSSRDDDGGGILGGIIDGLSQIFDGVLVTIGDLTGWVDFLTSPSSTGASPVPAWASASGNSVTTFVGLGDLTDALGLDPFCPHCITRILKPSRGGPSPNAAPDLMRDKGLDVLPE
jgi:hypothetical protein